MPVAMSVCPCHAAISDTMISGRVVASDTTVAPMMNGGIREADAIHTAASTKRSPPRMMQIRPRTNRRKIMIDVIVSPHLVELEIRNEE